MADEIADPMPPSPARVLEYLDQEMKIMGVLSGASGAAFLYLAKQLLFESKDFPEHALAIPLMLALATLGLACLFFYLQRSHLAWCFGQIALATAGQGDLATSVEQVDDWMTWINYRLGFVALCTAITAVVAAFLEKSRILIGAGPWLATGGIVLGLILGVLEYTLIRHRQHSNERRASDRVM